jgi:hypothetical protein
MPRSTCELIHLAQPAQANSPWREYHSTEISILEGKWTISLLQEVLGLIQCVCITQQIFLGQLSTPTPKSNLNLTLTSWTFALKKYRSEWDELRQTYLRAPDGLWLEDSVENSDQQNRNLKLHHQPTATSPEPLDPQFTDLGVNNPLSQHVNVRARPFFPRFFFLSSPPFLAFRIFLLV